jgi:hypothetical protein
MTDPPLPPLIVDVTTWVSTIVVPDSTRVTSLVRVVVMTSMNVTVAVPPFTIVVITAPGAVEISVIVLAGRVVVIVVGVPFTVVAIVVTTPGIV